MSQSDRKAWGDFWARQSGRSEGGCLPYRWKGIDSVQQEAWRGFAKGLPDRAKVLDLATGDGRVMVWLRQERPDLELIGVDLAPQLPPAPEGTTVHAAIAMEDLPFEDDTFDAVVSQFGFEYGDIASVTAEISRVVKSQGKVALMMHRLDGPILAHNRNRRMQIGWALERKDVIGIAKRSLEHRSTSGPFVPVEISQAVQEGAHRFGSESAAWEIPEAVRRTLLAPSNVPTKLIEAALDKITEQAANEIGRITSLEAACKVAADEAALARAFADADVKQVSVELLAEEAGTPGFADFRQLLLG